MTLMDFKEKIEKDYTFDKYFNYFFAIFFTFGGFFFLYLSILTDWGNQLSFGLFIYTLLFSSLLVLIGIIGFFNTSRLVEIYKIPNNSFEQGKLKIIKIAEKLKITIFPGQVDSNIIKGATYGLIFQGKDIIFFVDENNIYVNIQQRNYRGLTYLGYDSSKKLLKKIEKELKSI